MSEREQIVARLSELQAKQEAATEWGAAVGAREEEIRSLESRLLRIDAMTAPPSTETPRHTATPWVADEHQVFDLSGERIAVCNGHVTPSDEAQYARWKADAALIVTACNSHASLTARVAELEAEVARLTPAPLAWDSNSNRYYEPVELLAQKLYERFDYDGPPGTKKPAWSPHGNGLKMDEARHLARKQLREAGHRARAGEPSHDRR